MQRTDGGELTPNGTASNGTVEEAHDRWWPTAGNAGADPDTMEAFVAGAAEGARAERAAVVAWLRGYETRDHHGPLYPGRAYATQIEKGKHHG